MPNSSNFELYRKWWKKKRSNLSGFQKCYIAEAPNGEKLRADYNFHDSLVILSLELPGKKGSYSATVKKGVVIREKDDSGRINVSVKNRFIPYKDVFSCLPNDDLLKAVDGVFGISAVSLGRKEIDKTFDKTGEYSLKESIQFESFFERLARKRQERIAKYGTIKQRVKKRFWGDFHDAVIGTSLGSCIYFHFFDYYILGLTLIFLGVAFGGLDWLLRDRKPLITKILIFQIIGTYFFYTGYTYF